jgi:Tn7-like transposition protein D/TniQ
MLNLPRPHRDELVYSVIARYFAYVRPPMIFAAYRTISGNKRFSVKYARKVDELAAKTRLTWAKSAIEIIEEHTLLPFYGTFLPPELYLKCVEDFSVGNKLGGTVRLGLNSSSVWEAKRLRFCRSCVSKDMSEFGDTYWRRSHQLSGVLTCTVHGEILADSGAFASPPLSHGLQDATTHIQPGSARDCTELDEREYALAREISLKCERILQGYPSTWTPPNPSKLYQMAAIEKGYRIGMQKLDIKRLAQDFVELFQLRLLGKLGFRMPSLATNVTRTFAKIIYGRGLYHPLIHVLVQTFFEKLPDGVPSVPLVTQISWRCANPYERHPENFRVPQVGLRTSKKGKKYIYARCTWGFAFSFEKTLDSDPLMPVVMKINAYGKSFEAEARRLYGRTGYVHSVARIMKLGHRVAARLIAGRRSSYEPSLKYIRGLRKEWKERQSRNSCQTLMRFDRAWILKNRKPRRRKGKSLSGIMIFFDRAF